MLGCPGQVRPDAAIGGEPSISGATAETHESRVLAEPGRPTATGPDPGPTWSPPDRREEASTRDPQVGRDRDRVGHRHRIHRRGDVQQRERRGPAGEQARRDRDQGAG